MGKGRAPCCDKSKVKRGPWSPAEDLKLITFIQKNGHDNWRSLPKLSGLLRCGKSCRLRWINYLRPDVKRGNFTKDEEENIIKLHETLGNKWSKIASHFPGRTDNEIKNVWNTHLKKKLSKIDSPSSVDESKGSSIITSSSSSSTGSILSSRKRDSKEVVLVEEEESYPKRSCNCEKAMENSQEDEDDNDSVEKEEGANNDSVIEENPKDQATLRTTTSSDSSYGSNISNGSTNSTTTQVTQVDHAINLGDHEEEMLMDSLLLDFKGPYDVNAMLQEVKQPDQATTALLDDTEDSFWDMFGSNSALGFTLFDHDNHEDRVLENSVFGEEKSHEIANNKDWFKYLESELGLEEPLSMDNNNLNEDYRTITTEEVFSGQECKFSYLLDTNPEYSDSTYDLWPSNVSQNSSAI